MLPGKATFFGDWRGYLFGCVAVLCATLFSVFIKEWIIGANLALIYVLAVIITGLRYGSRPAIATSILSFLFMNFFLTLPHYTFKVQQQDEWEALVVFFIVSLVCGPAASRVRKQFLLLKEANRYSESMRELGQLLSVAKNDRNVWLATVNKLSNSLQADCFMAVRKIDNQYETYAARDLTTDDIQAISMIYSSLKPCGRLTDTLSHLPGTYFPVIHNNRCIGCAVIQFHAQQKSLGKYNQNLINSMLQQAADTLHRIHLVSELESTRIKSEIEHLRSALLSSVSHDLKSPLSAMMGAAESLSLLDNQLNSEDRAELIDTMVLESRRLDSYIQNLLDMTRLGVGQLNIEKDWVSIEDIIGSALSRLKRYHPNVKVQSTIEKEMPYLYVNINLIEQAIFNILENSVKYSPDSGMISVVIYKQDKHCIIAIDDNGPGIPEHLREKIFDMFYVVSDGDKKPQGTGMGLAICRGMIEAHNGKVFAKQSALNKGAQIIVELPIKQLPAPKSYLED